MFENERKSAYTVADLRTFHGLPDVRPFEEDARATVVSGMRSSTAFRLEAIIASVVRWHTYVLPFLNVP